jgi:hypothetical protein
VPHIHHPTTDQIETNARRADGAAILGMLHATVDNLARANGQSTEALRKAFDDTNAALGMIRDALEELGPVGCLRASEDVACNPVRGHILDEATALVDGISAAAERPCPRCGEMRDADVPDGCEDWKCPTNSEMKS